MTYAHQNQQIRVGSAIPAFAGIGLRSQHHQDALACKAGLAWMKLKNLIRRIEPPLVSEHLSWNSFGGEFLNDLAPVPYTDETLAHLVTRIS